MRNKSSQKTCRVTIMQEWIISANGKYFNHGGAFKRYGYIDWRQTRNFLVGDIIFIYMTKPEARIRYKTVVESNNMSSEEISDFREYWYKDYDDNRDYKYVRLKYLEEYDDSGLRFEILKEKGLRYAPQSPCRIKETLREYFKEKEIVK